MLTGKVSLFAGDLARQRAFDSILGHVNGQGVACFSAPCPFGDSQRATAGEKPPNLLPNGGTIGRPVVGILLCPRYLAISSAGKHPHLKLRSGWSPAS